MRVKVAIIGAGPSGLCCAKTALENNLIPVIYEKADQPSGLWIPNRVIWETMRTNGSKYLSSFIDFPWSDDIPIFPSCDQVYEYLISYVKAHSLEKYLKLNTLVENISKSSNNEWKITTLDLIKNKRNIEVFSYLIIANGINNKPNIPKINGIDKFKGKIFHSSKYRSFDYSYKSKDVSIIGCSSSAVEIAANLVGKAKSITNIYNRPYLIIKKIIEIKNIKQDDHNQTLYYNLIPCDFLFFTREINEKFKYMSIEEQSMFVNEKISKIYPEQFSENPHPNLKDLQLKSCSQDNRLAVSNEYIDYVKQDKIIARKAFIKEFTEDGFYLNDESFIKTEVVIFATSFMIGLEFFDKEILQILKFNQENYKDPIILYENTWHPELKNLAFIGLSRGFFFAGAELQAKWACKVFAGEIYLPSKDEMYERMVLTEKNRKKFENINLQFPYGTYVSLVDNLAKKLNLLPNFDMIKQKDENVYRMLWYNACLPFHFLFNTNYEECIKLLIKVDELTNKKYSLEEVKYLDYNKFK